VGTSLLIYLLILVIFFIGPATAAGTETLISTPNNNWNHQLPKIYGDQIVWQDSDPTNTFGTIYLYNITSGGETQVTDTTSYATNPAIFGNLIAYTACGSGPSCTNKQSTIYLYDISTGTRTPISPGLDWQDYPALYGNRIVWQDHPLPLSSGGNYQVYINGTSPADATRVIDTDDPSDPPSPAIYGDQIVWVNWSSGYPEIYLYNLTSNHGTPITTPNTDGWDEEAPAIYANRVVWEDSRDDSATGNYEIFINGTSLGNEYSLTPDELSINHQYPAISGNWVVWYQTNATTGNSDIYVNDTGTHQTMPIALDRSILDAPAISFSPAESLYRIVWDEKDASGIYNVYLYTNSSPGTCPVVSFTNDFAGGTAPVTVQFTDTSSQSQLNPITHWFWEFGDGSNSGTLDVGSANHLYTANGAYDVSLTVSNPFCRNATTVTSSVVVGRPLAGFTASPTSDVVNTPIAFTDTSLGNPTQWNWSWGDGTSWTNGTTQNPTHSYTTPGSYTVTLIASNTYGTDTLTKTGYITVLAGANALADTTINGVTVQDQGTRQYLVFNDATLTGWTFNPNTSVLDFTPQSDRGFQNISIYTADPGGFRVSGNTITGNISSVHLQTQDIIPAGFSSSTGGPFSSVNYSIDLTSFPENAVLNTKLWEGTTGSDATNFNYIAEGSGFGGTNGTAYTMKIIKTNFPAGGTATLHMSVNASLVASKPLGRNEVFVERISDNGQYGQVLGTRFLYHNSTENLDYFEADSPQGLSTFGLSFLEGAGNPFQLITLTIANYVSSSGSPDSGSPVRVAGPGQVTTPAVVQTTNTPELKAPLEPVDQGKTAALYANAQGAITQKTVLQSNDKQAIVSISQGIVAKDGEGNPLSSISIVSVPQVSLPSMESVPGVTYAGMAYDLGPDHATFSPAITFSLTVPQVGWGQEFLIKTHDPATGAWTDLPSTFDPKTGIVTTKISHFCCFALFERPVASAPPVNALPAVLTTARPEPVPQSPPAPTAMSVFTGIIVWISDIVTGNLYLAAAAAIAVIALLFTRQRRRRWDPLQ
jgi:beta propeller repeat protein